VNGSRDRFADIAGLSSLDDPVRRRLYEYVASCDDPVLRDDAATAVGISRTLAAYHLDKLAAAQILSVSYARPAGRSGPGAGRPAKRYTRTRQELSASVPPRNYALLAKLLAAAVDSDESGKVRATVAAVAHQAGADAGQTSASTHGVFDALWGCGYEPVMTDGGAIELRNCPFHQLAQEHTELVCTSLVCFDFAAAAAAKKRQRRRRRRRRLCVMDIRPSPLALGAAGPRID